jgi:hypothetical protein
MFIFIIFILQNADNLNEIPFTNPFTGGRFYINILGLVIIIIGIITIVALSGTSVVGSGLNEESTSSIRKMLFGGLEIAIYITPLGFYLLNFGLFGTILIVLDIVIILIGKVEQLGGQA